MQCRCAAVQGNSVRYPDFIAKFLFKASTCGPSVRSNCSQGLSNELLFLSAHWGEKGRYADSYLPFFLVRLFTILTGTPKAVALAGILRLTKLQAPITAFSPTITPGMITE